jgi:hypothetical protein
MTEHELDVDIVVDLWIGPEPLVPRYRVWILPGENQN